jgi:hypothetical protein
MCQSTFARVLHQLFTDYRDGVTQAEANEAEFDAADDLANLFRDAGYAAQVRAEADAEGATCVIFTNYPSREVAEFLHRRHISAGLIDWSESDHATATYSVRYLGTTLALVAHQRPPIALAEAA